MGAAGLGCPGDRDAYRHLALPEKKFDSVRNQPNDILVQSRRDARGGGVRRWDCMGVERGWLRRARGPARTFPETQRGLREANKGCLSPETRQTYLDEDKTQAQQRYEACERSYGRPPFLTADP